MDDMAPVMTRNGRITRQITYTAAKLASAGYVVGRAPPTSSNRPESGVQV